MGKVIAVCMGNVFTDKILNSSLPFLVLAAASLITFGCAQSNGKRLGATPSANCLETLRTVSGSTTCDGYVDCKDGTDEIGCVCSIGRFTCQCYDAGSCPVGWGCIDASHECDGWSDCADGSDELKCPSHAVSSTCMETIKTDPGAKVCDGFMNCKSGDDEINCYCPTDRFRCNCRDSVCPTGWWCITGSYRCDNWTDCTDGSDEFNCTGPSTALALTKTPKITPACQNIVAPENGTNVCDGYVDCPDKSDELGCICPENMFKCDCYNGDCSVGWGCIQPILQCNGEVDCVDGSDEKHCNGSQDAAISTVTASSTAFVSSTEISSSTASLTETSTTRSTTTASLTETSATRSTATASLTETSATRSTATPSLTETSATRSTGTPSLTETSATRPTTTASLTETSATRSTATLSLTETSATRSTTTASLTETSATRSTATARLTETAETTATGDLTSAKTTARATEVSTVVAHSTATAVQSITRTCRNVLKASQNDSQCNGYIDCPDGSDEIGCSCSNKQFSCNCYKAGCPVGWGCIQQSRECDGLMDCIDGSDEINCTGSSATESWRKTLSSSKNTYRCNGYIDFKDGTDEKGCTCLKGSFTCQCYATGCFTGSWGCIQKERLCNGWNDCSDGSDETNCTQTLPRPTCKNSVMPLKTVLPCDGFFDCFDKSDEKGCVCTSYMFKCHCYESGCPSGWGCISQTQRCSGRNLCGDWSDDIGCQCSEARFQCKNGACIERVKVNNKQRDCSDGDDEFQCNNTDKYVRCDCTANTGLCSSAGRCIFKTWVGDDVVDCKDGSDEPCQTFKTMSNNCLVIINRCKTEANKNTLLQNSNRNSTQCHSQIIPSTSNIFTTQTWVCITSNCSSFRFIFECSNGQTINSNHFCDGIWHCSDGSDERTDLFGFRCPGNSATGNCVLPQRNVYDTIPQCFDKSDLCFRDGKFECFWCLDGRLIISPSQVCDGLIDCHDMSDERFCPNQTVPNAVLGREGARCPSSQMPCHNKTHCVDVGKTLCNASVKCSLENNLKFCHPNQISSNILPCPFRSMQWNYRIANAVKCDGRPECEQMEDECNCQPRKSFCDWPCVKEVRGILRGTTICDGRLNSIIYQNEYRRSNFNTVFKDTFCSQQVEQNCPMRFNCSSNDTVSIDFRKVCDGTLDCDDHSDENVTLCGEERFYCKNGNTMSIDIIYVCDGIKDCDHGEDENSSLCLDWRKHSETNTAVRKGFQTISQCNEVPALADQYNMIASSLLRALFWIIGLTAVVGNVLVNVVCTKELVCGNCRKGIMKCMVLFLWSLTISDFLMGLYLLVTAVQGATYADIYCSYDKEWRSSSLCSGIGTLALLSSESALLTMAAISVFRLLTTRQLSYVSNSTVWIASTLGFSWFVSIVLAVIPRMPLDSGYFTSNIWFPNHFFQTDTVTKTAVFALAKKIPGTEWNQESWLEAKNIVSKSFKYAYIKGEFGYYDETSVCLPRFLPSTSDNAWQYTAFLLILNFILLIFITVTNLANFGKFSKQFTVKETVQNHFLLTALLIIVIIKCLSWIPVCILGFLSLGAITLPQDTYAVCAGFLIPVNSALNPTLVFALFCKNVFCGSKNKANRTED